MILNKFSSYKGFAMYIGVMTSHSVLLPHARSSSLFLKSLDCMVFSCVARQLLFDPWTQGVNMQGMLSRSKSHHSPLWQWMIMILHERGRMCVFPLGQSSQAFHRIIFLLSFFNASAEIWFILIRLKILNLICRFFFFFMNLQQTVCEYKLVEFWD